MAEQAAIGQDVIDFADALRLPRFAVAGYDWGGRAAAIAAALHPDRVRATVLIGGYTIQNTSAIAARAARGRAPGVVSVVFQYRARAGPVSRPIGVRSVRLLWRPWSPNWRFSDDDIRAYRRVVRQS